MTQRIAELARTLGQVSEQEEELLASLCNAARQELNASLREGVCPYDCPDAFALAGAWLALAGLEVSRGAGQADSFTAGDVTVRSGNTENKVRLLRMQAKHLLSGWTKDNAFAFYGV